MTSVRRLALSLAGLAIVASVAALYGPSEPWAGIDVGAVGASVFVLALVAGVWLFARRGDQAFPEHMSVAERRAWVGLLFIGTSSYVPMLVLGVTVGAAALTWAWMSWRFRRILGRELVKQYNLYVWNPLASKFEYGIRHTSAAQSEAPQPQDKPA